MADRIKVLITAPGFAGEDPRPLQLLKERGWAVELNETGTILPREELIRRVKDADGVLLGTERFDRSVIDSALKLKVISRYGVGMDNVDVEYARSKGIAVHNAAGANATAVADMALTMMLVLARDFIALDRQVRSGDWTEPVGRELGGKRLGIVGFGHIGAQVARRAHGFGMEVIAYDAYPNEALAREVGVSFATFDELIETCDIISLHAPLTDKTRHMIAKRQFDKMKDGAVLINTARGGLVDEAALAAALKSGKLGGAGLDVFEKEPLPLQSELLTCENLVLSPHTSADTVESARKVGLAAAQNIVKALSDR